MYITLSRVFCKIDRKYFKLQMKAFLTILHTGHNIYQIKSKIEEEQVTKRFLRSMIRQAAQSNWKSKGQQSNKKIKIFDKQQVQLKVALKSKTVLTKIIKLLKNNLHTIIKDIKENSTIKFNSTRSSKIQTVDSHKLFRRSNNDKKINKKSFSVDKSKYQGRNFLQAPMKYQPFLNASPLLSADYSANEDPFDDDNNLSSSINKFMQSASRMTTKEKKINLVNLYRNRSNVKTTSNQKYTPKIILNKKEEAIKQLFYLKKKYKKLIAEFNWFSQRFLKVIEQENYVK